MESGLQTGTALLTPPAVDPRYSVLQPLGVGGMASVWRARDERLGREVAIKVLHPHLPMSPQSRERFHREARIAAQMAHDNIVRVFDFGATSGQSYIAMELVEGETLREFQAPRGRLPPVAVVLIGHEIARALAYAHARGVVHRDVKPDNVLIARDGVVKLNDFGLAVVGEMVRLTASGTPVGTPAYLAPEQLRGETAGPRSDLFSLGVLLYEQLTGVLPFTGDTYSSTMFRIAEGQYARLQATGEGDAELVRVITRCLSTRPGGRYESSEKLANALGAQLRRWNVGDPREALATYFTTGALPDLPPHPTVRLAIRPRRRRWPLRVGAGVAVALLGGFGAMQWGRALPAARSGAVGHGGVAERGGEQGASASPRQGSGGDLSDAARSEPVAGSDEDDREARAVGGSQGSEREARAVDAPVAAPRARAVSPPAVGGAPRASSVEAPGASPRPSAGAKAHHERVVQGMLKVVTPGGWADVVVDGFRLGRTPLTLPLDAGPHEVTLQNPYRAPHHERVLVQANQTHELRIELRSLP